MSETPVADAYQSFHESVTDVYSRVIAATLPDDEGWARVGDALTELRQALERPTR
ncbi:hypothetical protein [Streptomyces sp. NPDC048157]|uniref:hypothetical protein n=1 Tax=Streptomyces sp. NPDC048157 TaxID=3365503 RepID=UPI003712F65F